MPTDQITLTTVVPEIILILLAVVIYVGGTAVRSKLLWTTVAVATFALVAVLVWRQSPDGNASTVDAVTGMRLSGPLLLDPLSYRLRCCAAGLGLLFCLFATQSRQNHLYPELLGSLVLIFAGLMLVCSAGDLVLLFLGLELISIPTYVLLFIGRPGPESDEATAKYFYLSILSSALLLYGFSLLYGLGGSMHLAAIQMNLQRPPILTPPLLPMALVLVLVGLGFKLTAVPFHFYAPDVYQATTNLNAALLAVVPKIAAALAMVRLLVTVFPHDSPLVWQLLILLSVITMTLGNVAALWQRNVRRLLAYSSIAHAGYLLLGLAAAMGGPMGSSLSSDATAAVVFYVLVYSAASLGAFASLGYLSNDDRSYSTMDELSGIGRSYPVIGGCLAVCMFSLSGIPPLAGFWGKFALFKSALDAGLNGGGTPNYWFLALCLLGVLNAAVAAAYYLRVVATLYFAAPSEEHLVMPVMGNPGAGFAALASVVVVIGVGLFTNSWMSQAQQAARSAWFDRVVTVPREPTVPVAAGSAGNVHGLTDSVAFRPAAD